MYISTLTHFLDEKGNIPADMPIEGREMAGFLALIVDAATRDYPNPDAHTKIRCFKRKCTGTIEIKVEPKDGFIFWKCNYCGEEGRISGWQKSKWDNCK